MTHCNTMLRTTVENLIIQKEKQTNKNNHCLNIPKHISTLRTAPIHSAKFFLVTLTT